MDADQKFQIISEGQKYGVTEACKKYGISRTLYYRWLNRYKKLGINGLNEIKVRPIPVNKTPQDIEAILLNLIKAQPGLGPREIKYRLENIGHDISESAVYNIMKRNHLSTKAQRIKYSSKRSKKTNKSYPEFSAMESGECWLFWTTSYGEFKTIGTLYEYTIFDYKSKIACSRLYKDLSLTNFIDLLLAVAIPVGQSLSFDTKHLCFFDDYPIKDKNKDSMLSAIQATVQDSGFNIDIHTLTHAKDFEHLQSLRKEYTEYCLSFILPLAQHEITFTDLKLRLQKHIREYNFNYKIPYDNRELSPIEYHVSATNTQRILPLWAYIDREY